MALARKPRLDPEFFAKEEILLGHAPDWPGDYDEDAALARRLAEDRSLHRAAWGALALAAITATGVVLAARQPVWPLGIVIAAGVWRGRITALPPWRRLFEGDPSGPLLLAVLAIHFVSLAMVRHQPVGWQLLQIAAATIEFMAIAFVAVRATEARVQTRARRMVRKSPLAVVPLLDRAHHFALESWYE
jgi:hypothetical protein